MAQHFPRATHTFAVLWISRRAWDEIAGKLRAAGYDHAFMDNDQIDMHGIAVAPEAAPADSTSAPPVDESASAMRAVLNFIAATARPCDGTTGDEQTRRIKLAEYALRRIAGDTRALPAVPADVIHRKPEDWLVRWLALLQDGRDDLDVARSIVADLTVDTDAVLALITAIRLNQLGAP